MDWVAMMRSMAGYATARREGRPADWMAAMRSMDGYASAAARPDCIGLDGEDSFNGWMRGDAARGIFGGLGGGIGINGWMDGVKGGNSDWVRSGGTCRSARGGHAERKCGNLFGGLDGSRPINGPVEGCNWMGRRSRN